MSKNESKYFISSSLMNQALLELLGKKDIEFITVTEVAKRAGVNRSTFYLHYDSVYDLLEETIENLNKEFVNSFPIHEFVEIKSQDNAFLIKEEFLVPYLEFCKSHNRVLKLIYQKPLLFKNKIVYKNMYDKIFYPAISQFLNDENEKIYNLEFFTQGVAGIVRKWIELDCVTDIKDLVTIIENCVGFESIKSIS